MEPNFIREGGKRRMEQKTKTTIKTKTRRIKTSLLKAIRKEVARAIG